MSMEAFEAFYQTHSRELVRFLLYRTGDTALAEDLAADTFERVIRTRRPFDRRIGTEKTWLYTIALNLLRDHLRRRGAEHRALERIEAPDDFPPFGSQSDAIELRDQISRGLRMLNDDEREAVALRYGADLSVPQIAAVTGGKTATIEKRLYRALGKLREEFSTDDVPTVSASAKRADSPLSTSRPAQGGPWRCGGS
jgi:RNA polymerase sigma-70 factor (ECF subfamily)